MGATAAQRRDSVSARLAWLAEQSKARPGSAPTPSGTWFRRCLQLTRMAAGVPYRYDSADEAWAATRYREDPSPNPPPGWIVWYDRGHERTASTDGDYGHVITSAGNGLGWSNDVRRPGGVDLVRLSEPVTRWGYRRVGDSRDVNGVVVVPDLRVPPEQRPRPVAGRVLTVRRGDTLSGLVFEHAQRHGVSWQDVWRDPHNAALRKLRGRPDAIRPGDHVWVP